MNKVSGGVVQTPCPVIQVKDGQGAVVATSTYGWGINWTPTTPGTYEVSAASDLGPYQAGLVTASRTVTVNTIAVAVTDDSGTSDDGIVAADGAEHTVQVSVKVGGTPVAGAQIARVAWPTDVPVSTTDSDGNASFKLSGTTNDLSDYRISFSGVRRSFRVAQVRVGYGVVHADPRDRNGQALWGTFSGYAGTESHPVWSTSTGDAIVPVGIYRIKFNSGYNIGPGYYLELAGQEVKDQRRTVLPLDARQMTLSTVRLKVVDNGAPVTGAYVTLNSQSVPGTVSSAGMSLAGDGTATYYVNPDPGERYMAMLTGGTPVVAGVARDLTPGPDTNVIDLTGAPVLQVTGADGNGNSVPVASVAIFANEFGSYWLYGVASVRVLPGSYSIFGSLTMSSDGVVWDYYFDPTNLADSPYTSLVTFAAGDSARTFAMGGSLTGHIDGPDTVLVNRASSFSFNAMNTTSRLWSIHRHAPDYSDWHMIEPAMEVKDTSGHVVATNTNGNSNFVTFTPARAGSYTVSGQYSGAGPLFPTDPGPAASKRVTAQDWYSFDVRPPWVANDSGMPVTVTVYKNGQALAGAIIALPPGSTVSGLPATVAITDSMGRAIFALHLPAGGRLLLPVQEEGTVVASLPLLVADDAHGVIHTSLVGDPGPWGWTPYFFSTAADGSHSPVPSDNRGLDRNYVLVDAGTYAVLFTGSGFYIVQSGVHVPGRNQTDVVADLTSVSSLSVDASIKDVPGLVTAPMATSGLTATSLGPPGAVQNLVQSGGPLSVQVLPGTYDLSLQANVGNTTYVAMEHDVAAGSAFTHTYQAGEFTQIAPVAASATGTSVEFYLKFNDGRVPADFDLRPGGRLYLRPGTYQIEKYVLESFQPSTGPAWFATFTGRSAPVTVASGAGSGLWQDLGGPLTPSLTITTSGAVKAGSTITLDFRMANAAGDRLTHVSSSAGTPAPHVVFRDAGGVSRFEQDITIAGPVAVTLPSDLPSGAYTVEATLDARPYAAQPYHATAGLQVQPQVSLKTGTLNAGPVVVPDGDLLLTVDISGIPGVQSFDLGVTYDPSRVAFADLEDSGATATPAGPGVVRLTGSTARAGGYRLRFRAVSGIHGPAAFGLTADSAVSNSAGPVAGLKLGTASVSVAASAVRWSVRSLTAPTVTLTRNVAPGDLGAWWQTAWRSGDPATGFDFVVTDPAPGSYTAIAMAPGALQAELQVTVGASGTVAPSDTTLTYGDFGLPDGTIGPADLQLMAWFYGQPDPGGSAGALLDLTGDGKVDLADLYQTARNYGQTAAVDPDLRGAIRLTVHNADAQTTPAVVVILRLGPDGQWQTAGAAILTLYLGDNTVSLPGLPPGTYLVYAVLPTSGGTLQSDTASGNVYTGATLPLYVTLP
ncbi:MAG TPA: hypothetical protein VGK74_03805 [Symbiobacteriaceae bacterium]|jgi:hypothetical protein